LLSFLDHSVEEGFISEKARNIIITAKTSAELLNAMEIKSIG